MINSFQSTLYKLSIASPGAFVTGVVMCIKTEYVSLGIALVLLGLALTAYAFFFLACCREELAPISVEIAEIAPNDDWCVIYAASYLLPLADFLWDGKLLVLFIAALALPGFMACMNKLPFHPVFLLAGWHCCRASCGIGLPECLLITRRRRIRRADEIRAVLRVDGYLLIDATE